METTMKKLFVMFVCVALAGCASVAPVQPGDAAAPAALGATAAPAVTATEPAAAPAAADAPAATGTVGQAVMDTAAECAKKFAALKACDQMSFPANKACRMVAEKKFSSLACKVVN